MLASSLFVPPGLEPSCRGGCFHFPPHIESNTTLRLFVQKQPVSQAWGQRAPQWGGHKDSAGDDDDDDDDIVVSAVSLTCNAFLVTVKIVYWHP